MSLDRRTFLQGMGVTALSALTACSARASGARTATVLPAWTPGSDAAFWRAVRQNYPLLDDPLYLNTGGLGPTPQRVLDTVFNTMSQLQQHSETGYNLYEPAREVLAEFLGVQTKEVAFVRNATEANCIIAGGLDLRAGDEIIFETHAHPGGSFPWLNQVTRRGAVVRLFEHSTVSDEENLERIKALVTPRTKVIQVSHITCTDGLLFPVKAIAEFARSRGIWFHIDAAQSVGMIPVNLREIGCDSFAISGHKWLGGPHESGALFIRRDRLADVALISAGAHSGALDFLPGQIELVDGTARHEYGSRNAGLISGLAEAARFQTEIGRERIAAQGHALASAVADGLAGVEGLTMISPRRPELRGSIVTFAHARASAGQLFGYLREHHGLRCRPVTEQGLNAVRVSMHVFNSAADSDRVIAGFRAAARAL